MNTENLNGILAQYVQHCKARAAADEGTVWRAVDCFGVNWDIEDSDFPAMFADAMQRAGSADPKVYLPFIGKTQYQGVTAKVAFDAKGELQNPAMTIFSYPKMKKTPLN